jgi:hypothetical protein
LKLSRQHRKALKYIYRHFPTPYTGDDGVIPRGDYQPPTQLQIEKALNIDRSHSSAVLDFLMAHNLVAKTYRYGMKEFVRIARSPGKLTYVLRAVAKPPDAELSDPAWGFECYQITQPGIDALTKRSLITKSIDLIVERFWKSVFAVIVAVLTAYLVWYFGLQSRAPAPK